MFFPILVYSIGGSKAAAHLGSKTCDNPGSEADDADDAEVLSDYRRILV